MLWFLLVFVATALVFWKLQQSHKYFVTKNVKHVKPVPLFGNIFKVLSRQSTFHDALQVVYKAHPGERYFGFYQLLKPILVLKDPELIRQIGVKDFDHFSDHMVVVNNDPIFSKNLFALKGEEWKDMRSTLSPAFTSSKMRAMYALMVESAEQFTNYFLENNTKMLEMKDIFGRYTVDVIANCAFGVKCDSLRDRNNDFYQYGREVTKTVNFKFLLLTIAPEIATFLGVKIFSDKLLDFFKNLVETSVKTREEQGIVRPDMIHLLMQAKKGQLSYEEVEASSKETGFATVEESEVGQSSKKLRSEITLEVMTAQALIFFLAGFEGASNIMCFLCYELALNPDIQDKLREEVDEAFREGNGKISYEALNKMKYLDMAVSEILRKWPGGAAIDRHCIKSYTLQPTNPGEPTLEINKGDLVWLPIHSLHHDPKYFPNPEKFDPERFSDENKANIKPYTYIPFGVGPRNCIGSRFALLETKVIAAYLLWKFEVVANEKTEIPLKLQKGGFNLFAANGFWLDFKKRSG